MCRTFAVSAYFFLTLMSALSMPVLSAQETSPSSHWANSLPNAPSAFKTIPEPQTDGHFTFRRFAIGFAQGQFSSTSLASWFNTNALLEREGQTGNQYHSRSLVGLSP